MQESLTTPNQSFVVPPSENSPNKLSLSQWQLPQNVLNGYSGRGIEFMLEWQSECLSLPGVLTGENLVICAPTSAGKTLVAELIALKCVRESRKKVLIILPFVSIVREKAAYLKSIFESKEVRVGGFMGNQSPVGGFASVEIAVCTIERANSLVNHLLDEKSVQQLGVVIVDEFHMIGDRNRGYLLELLLTKVLYSERISEGLLKIQLVGMSPAFPNVNMLAQWLQARVFHTNSRPIPLNEMIKMGSTLYDTKFKKIRDLDRSEAIPGDKDDIVLIYQEHVLKGHSVLIFCPTKLWCERLALTLAEAHISIKQSNPTEAINFSAPIGVCEQLQRTEAGLDEVLKKTIPNGVAFHHAGLTLEEREIIEGAYRLAQVKVLVATTTLSSGVNLPAQLVIVRTPYFLGTLIDMLLYKQMSGRAGRMGMGEVGESILMCKASNKKKVMRLFQSDIKPVQSCLCLSKETQCMNDGAGEMFALKRALLEVIASGMAVTEQDVRCYFSCTLFYTVENKNSNYIDPFMPDYVCVALEFLLENGFISSKPNNGSAGEQELSATKLGVATVASAFTPDVALMVFKELGEARMMVLENELHMIYHVSSLIDCVMYLLPVSASEQD